MVGVTMPEAAVYEDNLRCACKIHTQQSMRIAVAPRLPTVCVYPVEGNAGRMSSRVMPIETRLGANRS